MREEKSGGTDEDGIPTSMLVVEATYSIICSYPACAYPDVSRSYSIPRHSRLLLHEDLDLCSVSWGCHSSCVDITIIVMVMGFRPGWPPEVQCTKNRSLRTRRKAIMHEAITQRGARRSRREAITSQQCASDRLLTVEVAEVLHEPAIPHL